MRLCFAGGIATGKTTLATATASATGYPRMSFGGALRQIASKNGWRYDRESLQALGQARIEDMGYDGFLRWIVSETDYDWSAPLIVDGVRHGAIFEILANQFGPAKLVYIECSRSVQLDRLIRRDGLAEAEARRIVNHNTESYLPELEQMASVIVRSIDGADIQLKRVLEACEIPG